MADLLPPPPAGYMIVGDPSSAGSGSSGAPAAAPAAAPASGSGTDLPPPPSGYTVVDPNKDAFLAGQGMSSFTPPPFQPTVPTGGIVDDPSKGAGFWTNMRASLAPDVQDQIRRFAAARFPGMPVEQAVRRYGVIDGNIVYMDPQSGQFVRETPSVTGATGPLDAFLRTGDYVASGVGPAIPGAVGGATGALASDTGMSVPAAGAAAAATDVGRQALDRYLAGEPLSIDWLNSAGQGALAAGGQAAGLGLNRALESNPLAVQSYDLRNAADPQRQAEAAALEAEAKSRGVDLSAGQATGLRSLQATERQLGRYPETADLIYDFTQNQRNAQIPAAVRSEISQISPVAPGEEAVGQFRQGSQTVLNNALQARATQAAQSYKTALSKPPFWTDATFPSTWGDQGGKPFTLDQLMQRPSMQQAIGTAEQLAKEKGYTLHVPTYENGQRVADDIVPDWRSWDTIKQSLDSMIEGPQGTNPQTGRLTKWGLAWNNTRRDLLSVLDPKNPDWVAARLQYGGASNTVNELLDGGVGMMKQLQDAQPMDRQAIVRRIFDANSLTPEEVGRMRAQFALAGKQGDWNAGFASWLSDKLDASISGAGRTGNVPGQFFQRVWQDPRQQAIVRSALGGDQERLDGIEKLMQVVNASARGLPEGSPTASDMAAMQSDAGKMISRGARVIGRLGSVDTYTDLGNRIVEGWAAARAPQKRIALAQTLLSGGAADKLRELSTLSPTSKRALLLTSQIMTQADARVGGNATGVRQPSDFAPPAAAASAAPPQAQAQAAGAGAP